MRIVFVGASDAGVLTARVLVERGHEVVIIEADRARIDALYDDLDCSFLHGDGSSPGILREAGPKASDALLCVTDQDQSNILASLVGRSLGFKRVVTSIESPEYEPLCFELGLEHTIVPSRTIGRYLADLVEGFEVPELSTFVRGDARFFMFDVAASDAGQLVRDLGLPKRARVVCLYRDGELVLADTDSVLNEHDEVVILCHGDQLPALHERWPSPSLGKPR